jgi:hypothetical protein
MFQRCLMFILLAISLVGGFVVPAHAQDDQPIDMLQHTVLAPDACSPGCLAVVVFVTCSDPMGQLPPNQGSTHYFAGIWGPYWRGRWLPYTDAITHDGKHWRMYSFLETNHPTGTWSGRWREGQGDQNSFWMGFHNWKVIASGGSANWTYWHQADIC